MVLKSLKKYQVLPLQNLEKPCINQKHSKYFYNENNIYNYWPFFVFCKPNAYFSLVSSSFSKFDFGSPENHKKLTFSTLRGGSSNTTANLYLRPSTVAPPTGQICTYVSSCNWTVWTQLTKFDFNIHLTIYIHTHTNTYSWSKNFTYTLQNQGVSNTHWCPRKKNYAWRAGGENLLNLRSG